VQLDKALRVFPVIETGVFLKNGDAFIEQAVAGLASCRDNIDLVPL
jgi:hypothetical protein